MSRQTVFDGMTKERRRRAPLWDRVKVLVVLVIFFAVLVTYNLNPPFVTLGDAFEIAAGELVGGVLLVLMALEVLRQLHYFVSEHWAAYNHFWAETVFGGTERQTRKRTSDWTRFRIARLFKIMLFLLALGYAVMILNEDVTNPIDGLLAIPRLIGDYAFYIVYFIFVMTLVVSQFIAIFWFLSRGGIDIVFPEDIETRFDSVWGQDHVLDLVKENVAFLEKPDEIEAKGGYIPGGILLWGPPGTGKGEPVSSLLMTPTGPRRMGDLLPGDFVIGSDGLPTRIDQVHLLGERDLYRVRFSDGNSLRVTEDHLWRVTSRNGGTKVLETKQLLGRLTEADGHHRYRIPMVQPVEFEHRPVPLDPYLLGVLLGDGSFRHELRISSQDPEIIESVAALLPDGDSLHHHMGYDYDIVGGRTRSIAKELGLFGRLSHEKLVPEDYLWTSSAARLALLQGLMDSDGTVDQRGGIMFSSTSRALADAVTLLVQSFGGTCTTRERVPTYSYLGEDRGGRLAYEVRIAIGGDSPVFRLARKAQRVVPRTKYLPHRLITDIARDGREEARCIKVTADDHLYVSEGFTVTHNTLMAEAIAGEVGKPFVFVDPGAFIQMFMGVGILKVKRLFRKLRKLSLQHGGVIVFFDEADSLGNRGAGVGGMGMARPGFGNEHMQ
ncbi:MAG: AAA family ATPase, partial [Actinobacteria bacterium]